MIIKKYAGNLKLIINGSHSDSLINDDNNYSPV